MTAEQFTALIVAVTGLIAAVGAVLVQLRSTHKLMNGRMSELLDATKLAAQKGGELQGRDFAPATGPVAPTAGVQTAPPTGSPHSSNWGRGTQETPATKPEG